MNEKLVTFYLFGYVGFVIGSYVIYCIKQGPYDDIVESMIAFVITVIAGFFWPLLGVAVGIKALVTLLYKTIQKIV